MMQLSCMSAELVASVFFWGKPGIIFIICTFEVY